MARFRSLRRPFALLAALACLVGLVALSPVGQPRGEAAETRSLTVSPGTGLNTQAVTVSWSGFRPSRVSSGLYLVNIVQCKANPQSLADCYTNQTFPHPADGNQVIGAVTTSAGTGSAKMEIREAANLPSLACSQANPCSVLAYEITGTPLPTDSLPPASAVAQVTFAPSIADCPAVSDFDVRTGGEASAVPLITRVAGAICKGTDAKIVDVTESSSNEGRDAFLDGQVDLGVTSLAATADELATNSDAKPVYAPIDLTAVTVVFNMKNPATGQPITQLTLTPRLVARIVSDSSLDSFFSDPELQQLNPGVRWPAFALSSPLVRSEKNADTWLVTDWLQQDARARAFLDGNDPLAQGVNVAWKGIQYPIDVFESRTANGSYLPRQSEREVVRRVFYNVRASDSIPSTPDVYGFIGVVDWPAAKRYDLSTASLVNVAGQAVQPTTDSISAGYRQMRVTDAGTKVTTFGGSDPAAYPLVKIDYGMMSKTVAPRRVEPLGYLIQYLAGPAQQALPLGYVPLPADEVAQTNAIAAQIGATPLPPDTPPPTGTESTATTGYDTGVSDNSAFTTTDYSSSGFDGGTGVVATDASATGGTKETAARALSYEPVASYGRGASSLVLPMLLVLGFVAACVAAAPSASNGVRALRARRAKPAA